MRRKVVHLPPIRLTSPDGSTTTACFPGKVGGALPWFGLNERPESGEDAETITDRWSGLEVPGKMLENVLDFGPRGSRLQTGLGNRDVRGPGQ